VVCISGILKSLDEHDKINQAIFAPVLIGNSVRSGEIQLDQHRHISIIAKMRQDNNIFASLIRSFCPAIYGRELIKAGILLTLASYSSES
jgi:DNA replicative helicase MCM subunit Mcm2 (Cdc46/Mcm family)